MKQQPTFFIVTYYDSRAEKEFNVVLFGTHYEIKEWLEKNTDSPEEYEMKPMVAIPFDHFVQNRETYCKLWSIESQIKGLLYDKTRITAQLNGAETSGAKSQNDTQPPQPNGGDVSELNNEIKNLEDEHADTLRLLWL